MLFFMFLWSGCSALGLDFVSSMTISVTPGVLICMFVIHIVNSKPPNYAIDLILTEWFLVCEFFYLRGYLDNPPELWYQFKSPKDPRK